MSSLALADRTVTEVVSALRDGSTTSRALTEACLERIERDGARLNTYLALDEDAALAAADEADAALARGDGAHRALLGIPYALKDIFVTRALDDDGSSAARRAADDRGQPHPGGLSVAVRVVGRGAPA